MRSPRRIASVLIVVALALTVAAPAAMAEGDKTYDASQTKSGDKTYDTTKDTSKDTIVFGVTPGAFCSPEGALGKTKSGTKMICSRTDTDSKARWRSPHDVPGGFSDTYKSGHAKDIEYIAKKGITKGCNPPNNTKFCPRGEVTRAEMAAFIVRKLGLTDANHPGFKDVAKGSTFDADIRRLAKAGITRGCNPPKNDRFCPNRTVSRKEMSAFMVRALHLKHTSSKGNFSDVGSKDTFKTDINKLATAGITVGCNPPKNDRFCPDRSVTREQMASFVERGLKHKQ